MIKAARGIARPQRLQHWKKERLLLRCMACCLKLVTYRE
jgi:hypothetical protein